MWADNITYDTADMLEMALYLTYVCVPCPRNRGIALRYGILFDNDSYLSAR